MKGNIFEKYVSKKITDILNEEKIIVVLKGIPLCIVDKNFQADIEAAAENPIQYFLDNIVNNNRKCITYEEFLLLKNFIRAQYSTVHILKNNIYVEQYPIEIDFSATIKNNLLEHYKEPETETGDVEENFSLGKLGEIFTGIKEHKNILIGVYNDEGIEDEVDVQTHNLFENKLVELNLIDETGVLNFFDIVEESDFVCAVKNILYDAPQNFYVRLNNCVSDKEKIELNLKILQNNFSSQTKIFCVRAEEFKLGFEHRNEYTEILKKYWGYENFRNFAVYDLANLEKGIKSTIDISQEQIISDIVIQVESCENNIGRDIFVTAPTGAGKSAMFQVPAIYLAEKYNLLTIVISPLIGLMNDQVKNLEIHYPYVTTIHSDIAPPIKEEIITNVSEGKYHIMYISPETLLSRSDIENLIGERTIGMVVVDEAHIVTTWGKQFRPDYWYLGDHVRKLRKRQIEKKGRSFIIATFTATAIYGGLENMYGETIDSLHMLEPITYLGYMKRGDIEILIDNSKLPAGERAEFEMPKYTDIEVAINRAEIFNKKTLIYFPTVSLIEDAKIILASRAKDKSVAFYHGKLSKEEKMANYEDFLSGKKLIMMATKAFGMGIDINNIEVVMHFAPTGNVCDYVQEIGRAARRKDLKGEARYHYDKSDFKYINRLHGLSAIKKYQLIAVIKKIYDLYKLNSKSNLLLDAENFTYIFDSQGDENSSINKVKTALLMIQRDFEIKFGFSPISVRPIPLFSEGFFTIRPFIQNKLRTDYGNCLDEVEKNLHICRVNLKTIWRQEYQHMTFPQFKYFIYSAGDELAFNKIYPLKSAFCVTIDFKDNFSEKFKKFWNVFKKFIKESIFNQTTLSMDDMTKNLIEKCKVDKYKAQSICEIIMAAMSANRRYNKTTTPMFSETTFVGGLVKYRFTVTVKSFFGRIEQLFQDIIDGTHENTFYLAEVKPNVVKEYSAVLGILEAMGALSFDMTGGANSQIFIHINQIRNLKNILDNSGKYRNRIIDAVAERHKLSVEILTHIYEGNFSNTEIWDLLEDYFLGRVNKILSN